MANEAKVPFHKKEIKPVYQWTALGVLVLVVLCVAGWSYLSYLDSVNVDMVESITTTTDSEATETVITIEDSADIESEVSAIQEEIDSISEEDFADSQLDDESLGL